MPTPISTIPSYRLHRPSGQAVVTLSGKDFYLGPWSESKTAPSRKLYDRKIAEWLIAGRVDRNGQAATAAFTIAELVNAFRKSRAYPPSQQDAYFAVMKLLIASYGREPVVDFGSVEALVVRAEMEKAGWKRRTINQRVAKLKEIFRWGLEREMVPADQFTKIESLRGLRYYQTDAADSAEVQPVAIEHVEACCRFMAPTVAAMVRLQLYAGMRAGEMCAMKTGEIDTTDPTCWVYRPATHKTKRRGKIREIALGRKAIEILQPMLLPDLSEYIFSPARADAERRATRTANRITPLTPGRNSPGTNRLENPVRKPGVKYDTDSYRRAIEYATHQAFPPPATLARKRGENNAAYRTRLGPTAWSKLKAHRKAHHWHPHQLRHTFGTLVINQFTELHAQKALGQSTTQATRIYAKLSLDKAKEVARKIG